MKVKLSKKFTWKDTELTELELDLESLTGQDLLDAERGFNGRMWGTEHIMRVAARAIHIPYEELKNLPAKDFMNIQAEVMSFFTNAD